MRRQCRSTRARNAANPQAEKLNVSETHPENGAHNRLITPESKMQKAEGITSRFMPSATGENRLKKNAVNGDVPIHADTDTNPKRAT